MSAAILMSCAGPKVPAYKTKSQNFSWGNVYVWMSTTQVSERNALTGTGYLLINTAYKKNILNKNCNLTMTHISLTHPDGHTLIDQIPKRKDGSALSKNILQHRTGQFSLSHIPFKFERDKFPYEVNIKIKLNCPETQSEHIFSRNIEFRMVKPVIWNQ